MEMGKKITLDNETLVIRRYDIKKDEQRVLDLWKAAFNNLMPASLWHWKYFENPYDTTIIICENSQGMPVVFYGGVPFKSVCNGKIVKIIHLSDIMSHPDYRKSGLFIHTANAYFNTFGTLDDVSIMYGFPGKFHFDIGAKYLKYSHLGNGAAFFKADTEKIKSLKSIFSGAFELCNSEDAGNNKIISNFDSIWKNASSDYPLSVIRDGDYIRWRYFNHPQKKYEVWRYKPLFSKEWQAFAVIQIIEEKKDKIDLENDKRDEKIDGKTSKTDNESLVEILSKKAVSEKAVIVDMLAPKSQKIFSDFLGNIASMLFKRGIETVQTWVPDGHFLSLFLSQLNFKKDNEPIGIIPTVRLFDNTLNMNWVCSNFYYTMGDGDLF